MQAISSLIYAAARITDLQELGAIKALLAAKFGKEYATEAASDHLCRKWHVNDNLITCGGFPGSPSQQSNHEFVSSLRQPLRQTICAASGTSIATSSGGFSDRNSRKQHLLE